MKKLLEKCKGIKAMLLVVVMLLGFSAENWAQDSYVTVNNIAYYVHKNAKGTWEAEVMRYHRTDANATIPSSIVIPNSVQANSSSAKVVAIKDRAFADETNLKNITLPSTLKEIGTEAFAGCTNLQSITLPESFEKIKAYAFLNSGLSTVEYSGSWNDLSLGIGIFKNSKFSTLPADIVLTKGMFEGCPFSGSLNIPSLITIIPENCFKDCQITTVSLHNTAAINDSAFFNCPIKTLVLPDKVNRIAPAAFNNVQTLNINSPTIAATENLINRSFDNCPVTKIVFSDDCQTIGESFASGKKTLTMVTLPKDVGVIGKYAFMDCPITGNLTLNNTTINESAFADTKISNVTLTLNVDMERYIYKNAFANTNLETFKVAVGDDFNHWYGIDSDVFTGATISNVNIDGVMFNSNTFANCNLNEVSLDNTIVPEQAFLGNRTLKRVTLGANCLKINANAFSCCPNLQYAIFSNNRKGNTEIRSEAFANCSSLNDVTLNGSFTLQDNVFKGCLDNTDLTINDMSTFSENALAGRKWRIITVNNETPTGDCLKNIDVSTVSFPNATTLGENAILENSTVKTLDAPKLQSISHKAVGYAKNLTTVGTIKNGYLSSASSFDFGCVYSADRKTLLYICPGRSETILDSKVEKIDLQGTHFAAPGDSQERGIHVMDATYITDHNVTPINNNNARACAKFIRVADGCRKYFSAFEKLACKSVIVEPNNNGGGVKGDVNGDGKVTAADVQNLYEMLNE